MVTRPAVTPAADLERAYSGSRVAWGAIFAGIVVAIATMAVLGIIGLALGFSLVEVGEQNPGNGALTTTGIWTFVSQIVALFVGGFIAARLAGLLPTGAAVLHGATVWGAATIAAIWIATSTAGALFSGAASVVSGTASGIGSTVQAAIPDNFSLPDTLSNLSMDDLPEPVRQALEDAGVTPDNFQQETQEAFNAIVSPQQQQAIGDQAQQSLQTAVNNPSNAGQAARQFVDNVFGNGGILGEQDRQEALQQMQQRFGISEADANRFLDETQARAEELKAQAEQAIEEAKQKAIEAADAAADALATAAWSAGIASLLGLLAALGGAVVGRVRRVTV
ncbi:YrzE family protein [Falsirhodobacter halotolerans]|uniref:YrzE family protein n=1 Tax=Falsirhodobacter halotolerans TaxID=1146892 RepID=UPI001FD37F95|nr:YrzE family protein [Falsirhodobacter halotolerans]MCJ8139544.1 hypothetical protein [Falsirhodobacter halotolerans]